MRDNPELKVLVMSGHADLATPPQSVAYSVRHMLEAPKSSLGNIDTVFYQGGHMFYMNPPDLKKARADLLEFLAKSAALTGMPPASPKMPFRRDR